MNLFGNTWIFDIVPVPKPRMTRADSWKKRDCVVRYWEYKDALREMWRDEWVFPESSHLIFFLPMPKTWSKRKRDELNLTPHLSRPDADNIAKGVFDALFNEDSFVYDFRATKVWSETGYLVITEQPVISRAFYKELLGKVVI